ncbi:flagellar basal-body rod protein FlgF [Bacillus sp. EAC]|uniref:flagellar basal-body rod protein FlgF n=1 Tax=Bacillus sp. EAC TaxID=1978338 RepID=UPI000B44B088|nr:flagellar basal-body rod protein FlgF [Bacillus sp. EAC]
MLRSMYSGIGGMKNFQTKLDVIGNNIANVNTYGFKKGRVTFKDIASQTMSGASSAQNNRGGTNAKQIGLGSALASIDTIMTNSSLQTTGRLLDLGVDGDGFFVVKNGNQQYYTRAGNFDIDSVGNLVNSDGLKVQGYAMDPVTGLPNTSKLVSLSIDKNATILPQATTYINLAGNLDSNGTTAVAGPPAVPATTVKLDLSIRDSLGNEIPLNATFTKTSALGVVPSTWSVAVTDTKTPASTLATSNLSYGTNGQLTATPVVTPVAYNPGNGAQTINLSNINFSGINQTGAASSVSVKDKDGYPGGSLTSFTFGQSGEITGVFSNGQVKNMGQIALATFSNPGGLLKTGGNTFQESNNSGIPNVATPGNSRGVVQAGTLEMSNVDLSEEFTDMIVAQRGFQANSRIITTSDQILEELVNLKR